MRGLGHGPTLRPQPHPLRQLPCLRRPLRCCAPPSGRSGAVVPAGLWRVCSCGVRCCVSPRWGAPGARGCRGGRGRGLRGAPTGMAVRGGRGAKTTWSRQYGAAAALQPWRRACAAATAGKEGAGAAGSGRRRGTAPAADEPRYAGGVVGAGRHRYEATCFSLPFLHCSARHAEDSHAPRCPMAAAFGQGRLPAWVKRQGTSHRLPLPDACDICPWRACGTECANADRRAPPAAGSLRVVDSSGWSGDSEGLRGPLMGRGRCSDRLREPDCLLGAQTAQTVPFLITCPVAVTGQELEVAVSCCAASWKSATAAPYLFAQSVRAAMGSVRV